VADVSFGSRNRFDPRRAGQYLAAFARVKFAGQMKRREHNIGRRWKFQVANRVPATLVQRL